MNKIPYIFYLGRNIDNVELKKSVPLFWSACGFDIKTMASEVWIEVESGFNSIEPWITIFLNGKAVSRQMVNKGKQWICNLRGFEKNSINNLRVIRDNSAYPEDEKCFLKINKVAISKKGEFLPIERKNLKIEFIGDSITVGEGLYGAAFESQWASVFTSVWKNYAVQIAQKFNADFRIVAKGGWGIIAGWDNNPWTIIPPHYENICSIVKGSLNKKLGGFNKNNFAKWNADFVIVNLGRNDFGDFNNSAWKDSKTNKEFKLDFAKDSERLSCAVKNFLFIIRKNNVHAKIIWALGMMEISSVVNLVQKGIELYKTESSDKDVYFLKLNSMNIETEDEKGALGHPGQKVHNLAANRLIDFIEELKS